MEVEGYKQSNQDRNTAAGVAVVEYDLRIEDQNSGVVVESTAAELDHLVDFDLIRYVDFDLIHYVDFDRYSALALVQYCHQY